MSGHRASLMSGICHLGHRDAGMTENGLKYKHTARGKDEHNMYRQISLSLCNVWLFSIREHLFRHSCVVFFFLSSSICCWFCSSFFVLFLFLIYLFPLFDVAYHFVCAHARDSGETGFYANLETVYDYWLHIRWGSYGVMSGKFIVIIAEGIFQLWYAALYVIYCKLSERICGSARVLLYAESLIYRLIGIG